MFTRDNLLGLESQALLSGYTRRVRMDEAAQEGLFTYLKRDGGELRFVDCWAGGDNTVVLSTGRLETAEEDRIPLEIALNRIWYDTFGERYSKDVKFGRDAYMALSLEMHEIVAKRMREIGEK